MEESADPKPPPQDTSTRAYDNQAKQIVRSAEEAGGADADPGDPVLVPYYAGIFSLFPSETLHANVAMPRRG